MDKCECKGCQEQAEVLVYSRLQQKALRACWACAQDVLREDTPEYHYQCPNCSCWLPI